jgi:heat shock protein HtpX
VVDHVAWGRHRLINALQTTMLLAAMAVILGAIGWVVAGGTGIAWALAGGALLVILHPGLSPRLTLRLYGAWRLRPHDAPGLHALLELLARRAGLSRGPELYYVPSSVINAFAVGSRNASAIAMSDGMLRALAPRELAGVLAHEVSHVRHNDIWLMGLADLFSRLTHVLSTVGQILLLVNLPLLMLSQVTISWTAVTILIFAPVLSALMQLALSRTREYDADLGAAELTGDPRGLAMALARMERYQGRVLAHPSGDRGARATPARARATDRAATPARGRGATAGRGLPRGPAQAPLAPARHMALTEDPGH